MVRPQPASPFPCALTVWALPVVARTPSWEGGAASTQACPSTQTVSPVSTELETTQNLRGVIIQQQGEFTYAGPLCSKYDDDF